jgi:hypothetical protein
MKRQLYDLTDDGFAVFVNKIGSTLKDAEIPYNIVGGVSVQAYILDMLCRKDGQNLEGISHNPNIRLQDYIRSTDDIDIALDLKGEDREKMSWITRYFLPKLEFDALSPDEESILEYRAERRAASRPKFRVYRNDAGTEEDVIAMNISRNKPKEIHELEDGLYLPFIEQGVELKVPYSKGYGLSIHVPRVEHVFATKIAKSRAKDLMDIKNLSLLVKRSGKELNFCEIETILAGNMFEEKFEDFMEQNFS